MIFFDTNILVYSTINIDKNKFEHTGYLIEETLKIQKLFISPLVIIEYVYVLSKMNIEKNLLSAGVEFFSKYCGCQIDLNIVIEAYCLAEKLSKGKSINDLIHLKTAEQHCEKLVTYDKGFNGLMNYSKIAIEVI